MRERTSASQACGSTPFILAVTMRLYMAAARWPPRSDPQNSHDFLPRAMPRRPRSAALFERQTRPSSRNSVKADQRLSMYLIALARSCPRASLASLLAQIGMEIVDQGPAQRLPHRQALFGALAVDRALNLEQRVDAAHDLDRDRRQRDFLFARRLAARVLLDIGHGEERAARMDPTGRFPDRTRFSVWQIQLVVAVIGVGLQDAGVTRQMRLGVLALAIARVIENRRGRPGAAERLVVAYVGPHRPVSVLPLASTGTVVSSPCRRSAAMTWASMRRRSGSSAGQTDAHRVGHGRQRDRHAFQRVALGLPVQRLMLPELLEHDHRQQARARPSARQ